MLTIVMTRLPGRILRGEHATGEQIKAMAAALNRLHQIPARVVKEV
ncbi:phosphotransferase [Nonomuraea sp. NPDC050786]